MSTLQKKTLIGLLGQRAGTKLYDWLNPCCDTFCQDVNNCLSPFKSYVADLHQYTVSTTSGLLVVGREYVIFTLELGDNFTNVGFVHVGTSFIATGTTPTVWTNNTVVVDTVASAPVATTLLNNTGVTFTYEYLFKGVYVVQASSPIFNGCGMGCPPGQSTQAIITNNTIIYNPPPPNAGFGLNIVVFPVANDILFIEVTDTIDPLDNYLGNFLQNALEITIYP